MTRYLIPFCLVAAGCASAPGGTQERTYLCDGGRLAAVAFSGETARVRLANDSLELRRMPSGSGTRYGNERAIFRAKDDEALLTVDGRELGPCQEVKAKG